MKPAVCRKKAGADARNRTADPFITSEVLCQLSYVGSGCLGILGYPRSRCKTARERAEKGQASL